MQIVIEMPEEMYKWVNDVNKSFNDYGTSDFADLVKNGTFLPRGHGRLIDADAVLADPIGNTYKDIDIAETIIEADKAEGSDKE